MEKKMENEMQSLRRQEIQSSVYWIPTKLHISGSDGFGTRGFGLRTIGTDLYHWLLMMVAFSEAFSYIQLSEREREREPGTKSLVLKAFSKQVASFFFTGLVAKIICSSFHPWRRRLSAPHRIERPTVAANKERTARPRLEKMMCLQHRSWTQREPLFNFGDLKASLP